MMNSEYIFSFKCFTFYKTYLLGTMSISYYSKRLKMKKQTYRKILSKYIVNNSNMSFRHKKNTNDILGFR